MEREREKLKHFLHRHPLIFNEEPNEDYRTLRCDGCFKQVSGPNYSCEKCPSYVFNLHKSCAELPLELGHPLHPKHPLLLIDKDYLGRRSKCDGCNTEKVSGLLIYHCSQCNFSLDIECASLPLTIQAEIHQEHPLTLVRRSNCFTCDACGKEGKGMFYLCAICPFLVHVQCSSCPLVVKHIRHMRHPLHLINSLQPQLNQSDHRLCLLCVQKVNTNYMVYYCSTCDFVTHLHCAANDEELLWDDTEPVLDESIDSLPLPYVVKKSKLGEDNIEIAVEIKYFSHAHDLKLIDEQLDQNEEKCDGCVCPIYPPFYTCSQCTFFLHKSCVELPRKKLHPLHRHPLILLTEPPKPLYARKIFFCNACGRCCNGFVYHCDKCYFDLDVHCSLISDIFKHEGHEHRLILSSKSNSGECNSCGSNDQNVFCCESCDACEFKLDFKCATQPRTIRYGPHEQLFRLCYKIEDIDSDDEQYYCDICEEKRDPNHWFYYCTDLNFPAHPNCILGKNSYIKFGKTYMFDRHEHPLTFVDKSKGVHPPCNECSCPCNGWTFECVKCNFNLHSKLRCLR